MGRSPGDLTATHTADQRSLYSWYSARSGSELLVGAACMHGQRNKDGEVVDVDINSCAARELAS